MAPAIIIAGIHPDYYCQDLHNLLSTYYEDVLGVKGASGVSAPRPLKLRRSNPPLLPAPADAGSGPAGPPGGRPRRGGPRDSDPAEGWQRSPLAHQRQINLVVLDERRVMVCRNRTAIQLPAEFYLREAFRGTGNIYDRDMHGI